MPGKKKTIDDYIKYHGEDKGTELYNALEKRRESIANRRKAVSNETIKCMACGKLLKRITSTHLRLNCKTPISVNEYMTLYPDHPIATTELTKLYSNTKKSIVEKYGVEKGTEKWNTYVDKQRETNTFEYKNKIHNITEKEFIEYNKNRACTLDNFIKRHGIEEGTTRWEIYCERQRYTTSLDYFIEQYGSELGTKKYNDFVQKRIETLTPLSRTRDTFIQSKLEMQVFETLKKHIHDIELSISPYRETKFGPFDYGNLEKKKLIELYGSYWHADPRFFSGDFCVKQVNKTAKQIWYHDSTKRLEATRKGYSVYVIWEHDWKKNYEQTLQEIIKWWSSNER